MKLVYEWDPNLINIQETLSGNDVEFSIELLDPSFVDGMRKIQKRFDENTVITDVFFYAYQDHKYRVIVRKDYYDDFILELMKKKLVYRVEWK